MTRRQAEPPRAPERLAKTSCALRILRLERKQDAEDQCEPVRFNKSDPCLWRDSTNKTLRASLKEEAQHVR